MQGGAAHQHRHHDVEEVEDGAEIGPRPDERQQLTLQQAQHGNPRQQHDHLLPETRPLQAIEDRAAGHQQQPRRPGTRQGLQCARAQLIRRRQRAGAAPQPEHQRKQRHGSDAQGRQQARARQIELAGERGLDRQVASHLGRPQRKAVVCAQHLPQGRHVHRGQTPVFLRDLARHLGHALLHLRRQGVTPAAEVDQPGQRIGQRCLRPVDVRHHLLSALEQGR